MPLGHCYFYLIFIFGGGFALSLLLAFALPGPLDRARSRRAAVVFGVLILVWIASYIALSMFAEWVMSHMPPLS